MGVKYISNAHNVLPNMLDALVHGVDDVLEETAQDAAGRAKVDTGDLRDSVEAIPMKEQGNGKYVGEVGSYGVFYASAQEFGARGKPFLRPAIESKLTPGNIASKARQHWR